jgi:DNA modification methylase
MIESFLNKNIFGDCRDVMPHIPDRSVDMIHCDLPYETTKCSWDVMIPFDFLWREYKRIIKPNGAILLYGQTPFDKILGCSNLEWLRYEWIWEKTQATGHLNAKKMPMKAHENILVFYKNEPTYNPQKTLGHKPINSHTKYLKTQNNTQIYGEMKREIKGGGDTDRFPRDVLRFKSDKQKTRLIGCSHPTQKPLALAEYFINTYTNPGDVVLDNCSGSGTTGLACIRTGRNYILIENNKVEYDKSAKRLELNRY